MFKNNQHNCLQKWKLTIKTFMHVVKIKLLGRICIDVEGKKQEITQMKMHI